MDTKILLDCAEVGSLIGVGADQVRRLVNTGQMPGIRHGKTGIRIPRPALDTWLAAKSREALANVKESDGGTHRGKAVEA